MAKQTGTLSRRSSAKAVMGWSVRQWILRPKRKWPSRRSIMSSTTSQMRLASFGRSNCCGCCATQVFLGNVLLIINGLGRWSHEQPSNCGSEKLLTMQTSWRSSISCFHPALESLRTSMLCSNSWRQTCTRSDLDLDSAINFNGCNS